MTTAIAIKNAVTVQNGKPTTNSLDVAELFGKRHDHVRRDIQSLITDAPECAPNFGETWREVAMPNGGARRSKTFTMTKDGFVLLAMGFTGKEALRFKLAYIARFNEMEAELRGACHSHSLGFNSLKEFEFAGHRVRAVATERGSMILAADLIAA